MTHKIQSSTYTIQLFVGTFVGYDDTTGPNEERDFREHVDAFCSAFVEKNKIGVTVTETTFYYPGMIEPGYIIGFVNYPRFPKSDAQIWVLAYAFAEAYMIEFKQELCSLVAPDKTVILGSRS
jgi:hypothetical protein